VISINLFKEPNPDLLVELQAGWIFLQEGEEPFIHFVHSTLFAWAGIIISENTFDKYLPELFIKN